MPARLLQVVRVWDAFIKPPAPKMIVCVDAENGLYFRINSKGHWPDSVPIAKDVRHPFLDHNSFVECGAPQEWDDFAIDEFIRENGDLGDISLETVALIIEKIERSVRLPTNEKHRILGALRSIDIID